MRSFLLPLVAAALSVSALHADPVTVSAAIYGDELLAGCSSAPYCGRATLRKADLTPVRPLPRQRSAMIPSSIPWI